MAAMETSAASRNARSSLDHTAFGSPDSPSSVPDTSNRRHSLPQHFLPPNLWSANTSSASLVESEDAARGEHILDEATVAHRISALRQLNGATRTRHRYAKSAGARNSTFSQPVIVRTYSGAPRRGLYHSGPVNTKKKHGMSGIATAKMDLKLPPVEAFTFKGIMDEIKHGVAEDLERIAEICARSKYSLSNQYEVHMPPHGRGEQYVQRVRTASTSGAIGGGPTLQAIGSDDEHGRPTGRARGGRRPKSMAYGTLETIMSSSRSSEEDKIKKKPAAELAEEVRGRAAKKESKSAGTEKKVKEGPAASNPASQRPTQNNRSKSSTLVSIIIDNAYTSKDDSAAAVAPISLVSEPAQPRTSIAGDLDNITKLHDPRSSRSPTLQETTSPKHAMTRIESMASTLKPNAEPQVTLLESITSWLPWSKTAPAERIHMGGSGSSHAEGSLRDLLKSKSIHGYQKDKDTNR